MLCICIKCGFQQHTCYIAAQTSQTILKPVSPKAHFACISFFVLPIIPWKVVSPKELLSVRSEGMTTFAKTSSLSCVNCLRYNVEIDMYVYKHLSCTIHRILRTHVDVNRVNKTWKLEKEEGWWCSLEVDSSIPHHTCFTIYIANKHWLTMEVTNGDGLKMIEFLLNNSPGGFRDMHKMQAPCWLVHIQWAYSDMALSRILNQIWNRK